VKAEVRDPEVLRAISGLEVAAYLRASRWQEYRTERGRLSVWHSADGAFEVLLPLDRELRDYALRIGDAVAALAAWERRSEFEVLHDLTTVASDVIRIRLRDPEAASGTIPLEHAVVLVEHARDLLLASASAAILPRAVYGPRRPAAATEYVKGVRLGQTEWGSYVVTVMSRVTPELSDGRFADVVDPFERRVMRTLAMALVETAAAAERAALTGSLEEFIGRIDHGVSANLCDALVGMVGGLEANRDVSFEFSWSRVRPIHQPIANRVALRADMIPVIAEAARVFREIGPIEDFEVTGPVTRLERPAGAPLGTATVLALVGGGARRVSVPLPEPDYQLAVTAHADRLPLTCVGTLTREGRSWTLNGPREVAIVREDLRPF
jgi:hypothetical protein